MTTKIKTSVLLMLAFFIATVVTVSGCKKDKPAPQQAPYDLDVVLYSQEKNSQASGSIKFRQDPDTARLITLTTMVFKLSPNHSYLLQRAVNPITDSTKCSSTAWLTLGEGLQPATIHTDANGNGNANLWRDITAIARNTQFYIRFQVVDSATLAPALTSPCYTYTVR